MSDNREKDSKKTLDELSKEIFEEMGIEATPEQLGGIIQALQTALDKGTVEFIRDFDRQLKQLERLLLLQCLEICDTAEESRHVARYRMDDLMKKWYATVEDRDNLVLAVEMYEAQRRGAVERVTKSWLDRQIVESTWRSCLN